MKKLFNIILIFAMLMSALNIAAAADTDDFSGDGYSDVILESDFEKGMPSNTEYKRSGTTKNIEIVTSPVDEETHGNVLKIPTMGDNATDLYFQTKYNLVNPNYSSALLEGEELSKFQRIKYRVDVMFNTNSKAALSMVTQQSATGRQIPKIVQFNTDGTMNFRTGTGATAVSRDYETGVWYTFTFYIDFENNTYTGYLNDEKVCENVDINANNWKQYALCVRVATDKSTVDDAIYFDNLGFYVQSEPKLEDTNPKDGYDGFPVVGEQVVFKFNNSILNIDNNNVEVMKEDGTQVNDFTVSSSGRDVVVSFDKKLDFSTTYTVTVLQGISDINGKTLKNDESVTFTTMGKGLSAVLPQIYDENGAPTANVPDGGLLNAKASVYNPYEEEKNATLVIAAYAKDGRMISYNTSTKAVAGGTSEEMTAEIDSTDANTVAAFVADDLDELNLLHYGFALISKDGSLAVDSLDKEITDANIDKLELSDDGFYIEGSIQAKLKSALLLCVKFADGYELLAPVYTDNGKFIYEYANNGGIQEGLRNIYISGRNLGNKIEGSVFYTSPKTREELLKEINDAKSVNDVEKVMEKYEDMLDIEKSYLNKNAYTVLFEQKPYQSFTVVDMIYGAKELLDKVNNSYWSALTEIFEKNNDIILHKNSDYPYYKELSSSAKGKINMDISSGAPYADFASVRKGFSKAVDKYKEENNRKSESKKSSGGGSGGASYNSSKSMMLGLSDTAQKEVNKPAENNLFTDLAGYEWAEDSVRGLYSKGIIAPDVKFRPYDDVTREEFVKMLVNALSIKLSQNPSAFSDVDESAWYCPYIAAAQQAGIVAGDENGLFGTGRKITRQDMAVMVYRALVRLQKLPEAVCEKDEFLDEADMSNYAKDSIYALQTRGIILGTGQGQFTPLSPVNRAQAAKLISNLINSVEGER